jgi:hypothetical protein
MSLAETYIRCIVAAYEKKKMHLFEMVHGASEEDLRQLKSAYPDVPESLVYILSLVDGTYYRKYNNDTVTLYMFDGELPYYLDSVKDMLKGKNAKDSLEDIYEGEYVGEVVGPGIDAKAPIGKRLHISDCMNNGGSSQLFIDFCPAMDGVKGQIIRCVHDPDEYTVIAENFDTFLQQQLDRGFGFIENDENLDEFVKRVEEKKRLQPFFESLRKNDPDALQYLKNNLREHHILGVSKEAPSSGVLRVYLAEMLRLYAIRDEITPAGYTYGDQYDYLAHNFFDFQNVWKEDAPLAQEVLNFAREVEDLKLLALFKDGVANGSLRTKLAKGYTREQVQEYYLALTPEEFFKLFSGLYDNPVFMEYFEDNFMRVPVYGGANEPRKRIVRLDPRWKALFLTKACLTEYEYILLCDMTSEDADVPNLKRYMAADRVTMRKLAWFGHALCLLGDVYVEREYPYLCETLLSSVQSGPEESGLDLDSGWNDLERALDQLGKKSSAKVYEFTFILSLCPPKAAQLVASLEPFLKCGYCLNSA